MESLRRKSLSRVWRQDIPVCAVSVVFVLLLADTPDWRLVSLGIASGLAVTYAARKLHKRYPRNKLLYVLLGGCFLLALFMQIVKFHIFPEYYFYDARSVQRIMVTDDAGILGISYLNTARLCKLLNVLFPMDGQLFGGLFFFFCGIPVGAWTLSLVDASLFQGWNKVIASALLLGYCVLLPVFVWNTQKEAIQFLFLVLMAMIFQHAEENPLAVGLGYIVFMLVWGLSFRAYYLLILVGSVALYFLLQYPKRKSRVCLFAGVCMLIVMCLLVLKQLHPSLLKKLFDSRARILEADGANRTINTAIKDIFANPNQSVCLYLLNYAINAVRMMLPLELLGQGVLKIGFAAWQLFNTGLLGIAVIRCWKKTATETQCLRIAFVMCWYMVAFLFEPDFGSFVRHQTALFPILYPLCIQKHPAKTSALVGTNG